MHESSSRTSLKTPRHDGEVAFVPDLAQMKRDVQVNAESLSQNQVVILGKPLNFWRRNGRNRLIESAQQYSRSLGLTVGELNAESPLIVTGHQAQFYHCGIFIKYVLADHLTQHYHSCPVNLVVDSDLPKNLTLNLPVQSAGRLGRTSLGWQGMDPDIAMEYQTLPDKRQLDRWLESMEQSNVAQGLRGRIEVVGQVMRQSYQQAGNLVEFYTLVNHGLAQSLALNWLEWPVSRLGEIESFWAFVGDLAVHCARCHRNYNEALRDYRRKNKVRNSSQPLPDLGGGDAAETIKEMPFWVFRPGQPRRTLWVEPKGTRRIFFDRKIVLGEIDFSDGVSSQNIIDNFQRIFTQQNIALRPRALTLTIFARLFLADYFIHGIGGARYDQVTDRFIRTFYGFDPPSFACASATVRLPFANGNSIETIRQKLLVNQRQQRNLRYNPQRFVAEDCQKSIKEWMTRRQELIDESDRLRQRPMGRERRSEVFREIREVNALLAQDNVGAVEQVKRQRQRLLAQLDDAQIMADREYCFGLFEPERLSILRCDKT